MASSFDLIGSLFETLQNGLNDILAVRKIEISPLLEAVSEISQMQNKMDDLLKMLRSTLEQHTRMIRTQLEGLQTDLLLNYISKWQNYHFSIGLLTVCLDKQLIQKYSAKNPTKKALRPPSNAPKPGSKYLSTSVSNAMSQATSGITFNISLSTSPSRDMALFLWKTELFDYFKDRLLNQAFTRIHEDRESTFHYSFENNHQSSMSNHSQFLNPPSPQQSNIQMDISNSSSVNAGVTSHDIWVPLGGDTMVRDLVDHILKLGASAPEPRRMEFYVQAFEVPYIRLSQQYYKSESEQFIEAQGITSYLHHCIARLAQEQLRSQRYLHPISSDSVNQGLIQVAIVQHKEAMLAEFLNYLQNDRRQEMANMHNLLSRVADGTAEMKLIMAEFIKTTCASELKDLLESSINTFSSSSLSSSSSSNPSLNLSGPRPVPKNLSQIISPSAYVDTMYGLYQKFSSLVYGSFVGDLSFVATMDKTYKIAINQPTLSDDPSLYPDLLAKQSDILLKKGSVSLTEAELEAKIAQLIHVLRYIEDKDIFQKRFARMLSRRLISSSSVSEDAERAMLNGLKPICSPESMLRLQRMFNDIPISAELTSKFAEWSQNSTEEKDHQETNGTHSSHVTSSSHQNLGLSFFILTTGSWPVSPPTTSLMLPPFISNAMVNFAKYYDTLHSGRKLNWVHTWHRGEVKLLYLPKKYEISATAAQIAAMLLFEDNSVMTLDQISNSLGNGIQESAALVSNLLECKVLTFATMDPHKHEAASPRAVDIDVAANTNISGTIPITTPSTGATTKAGSKKLSKIQLSPASSVTLNRDFTSKKLKFKLPSPTPTEAAEAAEAAHNKQEVEEDRSSFLQAVIVRTMKTRKELHHNDLTTEVINQCKGRFRTNLPMIKRQIDTLIEKEYLKRSPEKLEVYLYVA